MHVSKRTALGAAAIATIGFGLPALADHGPTTKTSSGTQTQHCQGTLGDDNTVALTGPEVLWPPNHQFVNESATATDANGGNVSLTITPTVGDVAGGDGGAQHDPDFAFGPNGPMASGTEGTATVPFQLRAERSGKGDGRTYTIDWSAQFSDGTMCSSMDGSHQAFTITVPHDMGHRA